MANTGIRLTKRVVDQADGSRGRHYLWDGELRGFGLQVEKSGAKAYFVRYRPKGQGRDGVRRFYKLGRHGDLTPDQAREQAKSILGQVAIGRDPAAENSANRFVAAKREDRLTVEAPGELFLCEHVATMRKARTFEGYESHLRRHLYPLLGARPAEDVTRVDVARFHGRLSAQPHTANRTVALVSSMYSSQPSVASCRKASTRRAASRSTAKRAASGI